MKKNRKKTFFLTRKFKKEHRHKEHCYKKHCYKKHRHEQHRHGPDGDQEFADTPSSANWSQNINRS